ncbi:hypothetical protein [Nitrospirillum iridis]|uniref:Uncharacterized protein n=1 Tax=Nitrospirillum iridis TaxID=765888 RepID=A0A7X0EDK0_9PROT|nr:hypothetical protein [Nitrospirillum iridis]MBB6251116.1 hypothetical protein [Nitrospirillum iridis]
MATRTTETTVTFRHAFRLAPLDELQPAGTYQVSVEEESIDALSFLAFRRAATLLHLPALATASGVRQTVPVDPQDLANALDDDKARVVPVDAAG